MYSAVKRLKIATLFSVHMSFIFPQFYWRWGLWDTGGTATVHMSLNIVTMVWFWLHAVMWLKVPWSPVKIALSSLTPSIIADFLGALRFPPVLTLDTWWPLLDLWGGQFSLLVALLFSINIDTSHFRLPIKRLQLFENFHSVGASVALIKIRGKEIKRQQQGRDSRLPQSETDKSILSSTFRTKALRLES